MLAQGTVAERERRFTSALIEDGLRLTHQRLEIIREIAGVEDHPDAEEVLRRVRVRVPTLSQDTVYRALTVLADRGLITRITTPRATRFDPDTSPHCHFVCDACGRLEDVSEDTVPSLSGLVEHLPLTLPGVGEVRTVHVEMCGRCEECQGSSDR